MQLDTRVISQSNVTGGKNPVVVEGFHPEVIPYLENSFVIFQRCEDQDDYFTSEESVLNALKPNLYISNSPSEFDIKLCNSFNCRILSLFDFIKSCSDVTTLKIENIAKVNGLPIDESTVIDDSLTLDFEETELDNPSESEATSYDN